MRASDNALGQQLTERLAAYERDTVALPGIRSGDRRRSFVEQLVESDRRDRYISQLLRMDLSGRRLDPASGIFDPLRGAILLRRRGEVEEAFWMVFLSVQFGRHRRAGWRYAAEVYRGGGAEAWTWTRICADVPGFRDWLDDYQQVLHRDRTPHGFGNHRKYEHLSGWGPGGTGESVADYVDWVTAAGSHELRFGNAVVEARGDAGAAFDLLYQQMNTIARFGRTARFDYLSMVGKLGLAGIRPARAYLPGSTGPLRGARLLFTDPVAARPIGRELERSVSSLAQALGVGSDTMEDALCNWQKSPDAFMPFRG